MKLLVFSDVHWSTGSSLVKSRGKVYSTRLEMLINSMNWVNEMAIKYNCSAMICAGDFFDKAHTTDEELTALREIKWNSLPCYFLCGNHESSVADLRFSSLKALESDNHFIVSDPMVWKYNNDENEIRFLPYVTESDKKPLAEYFSKGLGNTILISHNDIAGINYGGFESRLGFSISEIEENCSICLNGHLHNSEQVSAKVLNVGSFSGHNFTNDSSRYNYGIWILDTDTNKLEFVENPYSLNFYKLDITETNVDSILASLKTNAVVSAKCKAALMADVSNRLKASDKILASRLTVDQDLEVSDTELSLEDLTMDHLAKFREFMIERLGTEPIILDELSQICK